MSFSFLEKIINFVNASDRISSGLIHEISGFLIKKAVLALVAVLHSIEDFMTLLNGKAIAQQIHLELAEQISHFSGRVPCLAVILVGSHPASQIYVKKKVETCKEVGIQSILCKFTEEISEKILLEKIAELNFDNNVDGILVQLPLPAQINPTTIVSAVAPEKDVDGLHPMNAGKLLLGMEDGFAPCTPLGIKVLLERSHFDLAGKHVVIMGRSNLVGKPLAALLMQNTPGANASVTLLHSRSQNILPLCQQADVLIAAMGKPLYVSEEMVRPGAVVIDVGINKVVDPASSNGYRIVGDVDFAAVQTKCGAITPVPGGVGPMTIAMLLSNTCKSYLMHVGKV